MPRALKISEAASLALHAMGLIAVLPGGRASARVIASRFEVSEAHLSKVLQRLVKAGLLRSVRGPKGGFSLPRSAEEITLLEVCEAIEGPFDRPLCEGPSRGIGIVIGEANEYRVGFQSDGILPRFGPVKRKDHGFFSVPAIVLLSSLMPRLARGRQGHIRARAHLP